MVYYIGLQRYRHGRVISFVWAFSYFLGMLLENTLTVPFRRLSLTKKYEKTMTVLNFKFLGHDPTLHT